MKDLLKIVFLMFFILTLATVGFAEEKKESVVGCTSREKVGELVVASMESVDGNKEKAIYLFREAFSKKSADWCEVFGIGYTISHIPTGKYFGASANNKTFSIAQVLVYNGKESVVLWVVKEFYPQYFEEKTVDSDPSIVEEKTYNY